MKTAELQGAALDWAVAKCEGKDNDCEIHAGNVLYGRVTSGFIHYQPSTDWAQGGPIIERERICIDRMLNGEWIAVSRRQTDERPEHDRMLAGSTPLIAVMRCYVASKLGDEVEIPEELI